MYAGLMGNHEKHGIKSPCGNNREGRIVYDAFVLANKAEALYYSGTSAISATTASGTANVNKAVTDDARG